VANVSLPSPIIPPVDADEDALVVAAELDVVVAALLDDAELDAEELPVEAPVLEPTDAEDDELVVVVDGAPPSPPAPPVASSSPQAASADIAAATKMTISLARRTFPMRESYTKSGATSATIQGRPAADSSACDGRRRTHG
jgi:hypothetical protein